MVHLYKTSSLYYNSIEDLYSWEIPNTYINREYEVRINIFPYNDQIAFSCTIEDENIQIFLPEQNYELKNNTIEYAGIVKIPDYNNFFEYINETQYINMVGFSEEYYTQKE